MLKPGRLYTEIREPFFFSYVRDQLIEQYGANFVRTGGLRVYTTIDPRFQRLAAEAIKETLNEPGDPASAVVAINPANGAIRAMVSVIAGRAAIAVQPRRTGSPAGGLGVQDVRPHRGDPARHQPGLDVLPVGAVHLAARREQRARGRRRRTTGRYYGPSTLTAATLRSDNSVYARLTLDLGPESIAKIAHEMGVRSPLEPVASIGLGSNDVSVLDMASGLRDARGRRGLLRADGDPQGRASRAGRSTTRRLGRAPNRRSASCRTASPTRSRRILEQNVLSRHRHAAPTSAGRPPGRRGRPTTTPTPGSAGTRRLSRLRSGSAIRTPTIEMTSVHGIAVSGGSFPADIWNLFVSRALAYAPVADFPLPRQQLVWRPWQGQYKDFGSIRAQRNVFDGDRHDRARARPATGRPRLSSRSHRSTLSRPHRRRSPCREPPPDEPVPEPAPPAPPPTVTIG